MPILAFAAALVGLVMICNPNTAGDAAAGAVMLGIGILLMLGPRIMRR